MASRMGEDRALDAALVNDLRDTAHRNGFLIGPDVFDPVAELLRPGARALEVGGKKRVFVPGIFLGMRAEPGEREQIFLLRVAHFRHPRGDAGIGLVAEFVGDGHDAPPCFPAGTGMVAHDRNRQ